MEFAVALKVDVENPDIGDMYLDATGETVLHTELAAEVAQRLQVRFSFFLGEYFLDLQEGTPWIQRVMVKAPSDLVIRTVLGNIIRTTEGVSDLVRLTYSISRTRTMSVSFQAKLADGTTFSTTDYTPFVLDLAGIE